MEEILKKLVDEVCRLNRKNGELTAAINILIAKPELINDKCIIEELGAAAND